MVLLVPGVLAGSAANTGAGRPDPPLVKSTPHTLPLAGALSVDVPVLTLWFAKVYPGFAALTVYEDPDGTCARA